MQVYVYDLSRGLARQFSPMIMGKQVDGIWHTSVVVYGMEYYYGQGIQWGLPGRTPFGAPVQVLEQGDTHVPQDVLEEFLVDLSARFGPLHYDLLDNNCNNFSNEVSQMLTGCGIPDHILSLPSEFRTSPLGAMLAPYISAMQSQLSSYGHGFDPSHPHAAAQAAAAEAAGATAAAAPSNGAATVPASPGLGLTSGPSPPGGAAAAPRAAAPAAGAPGSTPAPRALFAAGNATPAAAAAAPAATPGVPALAAHATPAATAAALRQLGLQETPAAVQGGTSAVGGVAHTASSRPPAAPCKASRSQGQTAGSEGMRGAGGNGAGGGGAPTPVACALGHASADAATAVPGSSSEAGAASRVHVSAEVGGSGKDTAGGEGEDEAARKARVAAAIRREFDSIMAIGGCTPNEAAALALKRVVGSR